MNNLNHLPLFFHDEMPVSLEIHFALPEKGFREDPEWLWEGSRTISLLNQKAQASGLEHSILELSLHIFKDSHINDLTILPRHVADISAILEKGKGEGINLDKLVKTAKDENLIVPLYHSFAIANSVLRDDFLFEAKKASKDKLTGIEIKFLMPKKERNVQHEYLIRKRLRAHFKKHSDLLEMEIKQLRIKGLLMAVFGVVMIFVAASLLFAAEQNYLIRFLEVLLEPAGWFTAWTGLDQIFYKSNEKKPDLEFYDKMMHADIVFLSY